MTQAVRPIALIAAFAVVYFVWGSTYLAIRIAVMDVPPGLLAGIRFLVAGLILGAIALAQGHRIPRDVRVWRVSAVMGVALIVIGNGVVTWAEQWVPSNQTALIIASSALWMAWFGTFGPRGTPLSLWTKLGLAVGFAGVGLLMLPGATGESGLLIPMLAILCSSMAWCGGTIYGRNAGIDVPPLMFAACQMLIGGGILTVWGVSAGELGRVEWTNAGLIGLSGAGGPAGATASATVTLTDGGIAGLQLPEVVNTASIVLLGHARSTGGIPPECDRINHDALDLPPFNTTMAQTGDCARALVPLIPDAMAAIEP